MADSILEKIMKNVKATLETITVANGYANTIRSVQRMNQGGQVAVETPYILITQGEEEAEDGPHPLTTKRVEVFLAIVTVQDTSTDPKSADEVLNSICADIEQAMLLDHQRGTNAVDTEPPSTFFVPGEDGEAEIERLMKFTIAYQHKRGDPRSLT